MATYKKPTIEVNGTTLMGENFSGDANTYEALKAHKTIKAKVDDKDALVPFHAVKNFDKIVSTEDAERTDPYCGGGSDPVGEVWYTGTLGECDGGIKITESISETDKANTIDLFTNPTTYDVSMNGTPLALVHQSSESVTFADNADELQATKLVNIETLNGQFEEGQAFVKCPTDITNVEVTVAKK